MLILRIKSVNAFMLINILTMSCISRINVDMCG